ncbi:ABC transporter family substrate-binding protein [Kutzneria viridogrisea]|uniref:Extracellular solute-binding protein family 5 n=2 Tax=Kutzneria TaxID=43356 RepID=W5W0E3_9PSEU|nr:ABC transporter family substrate-binding protein [Kutzneria albida]AHH94297.1 extracellular solute-binding protein family 5 [Kutzneria albida DSM 43870]MBA8929961.1 peptide/nickel transport system substrate-binding protein [Kutzneria viridogrisea]
MRRSKAISAVAAIAGAALVLTACGSGGGDSAGGGDVTQNADPGSIGGADQVYHRPQVKDIGEVNVAVEENFHNYNNFIGATNNFANTLGTTQTLPSPFFTDLDNGKLVVKIDGDLMDSVKVTSTAPQVVEWKINQKAVWSDGQPFACKDFYLRWLASSSKAQDANGGSIWDTSPTGYENISKLECSADGKTVTTTFSTPFADWRSLFSSGGSDGLLPAHVLEAKTGIPDITKVTDADKDSVKKAAEFWTKGWLNFDKAVDLSAGPYVITQSDLTNLTVLERNPKWWGPQGGPAKIVIKTNTDAASAAQQLQNKEVQVIAPQADNNVAQTLRQDSSSYTVYAASGQTFEHLDFNLADPILKDIEVRKAIAQCVPRQGIVDNLVKDVTPSAVALGNLIFMPNEVGYKDNYSDLKGTSGQSGDAGIAEAKKTLEAAGWKLGGDGIYAKDGKKLTVKIGHKIVQRRADTVRLIQAACHQAGVDIQDDQAADFNSKRLPASEFQSALFAWIGQPNKAGLYGNYAAKDDGGSANYQNLNDKAMDKLFKDANQELDYKKRIDKLNAVDKAIHDDYASVPLFQLPDFAASISSIGPISYVGVSGGVLWNAETWQKK